MKTLIQKQIKNCSLIIMNILLAQTAGAAGLLNINLPASQGEYSFVGFNSELKHVYMFKLEHEIDGTDEIFFNTPAFTIIGPPSPATDKLSAKDVQTTINFYGLSSDGDGYNLLSERRTTFPGLETILLSGNSQIRVREKWKFVGCDDVRLENKAVGNTLDSAIESIRSLNFRRYMNCNLNLQSKVCSETDSKFECSKRMAELIFKDDGSIQIKTDYVGYKDFYATELFKANRKFDESKQANAEKATSELIDLIKDYGMVLIKTFRMNATDRNTAANSWIRNNRKQILDEINIIESNLADTETLTKLNILYSINRADQMITNLESQVSLRVSLDELVRVQSK